MIKKNKANHSVSKGGNKKTKGSINLKSLMALANESDIDALALSVEQGVQHEIDPKLEERIFKRVMKKIARPSSQSRDLNSRDL